VATKGTEKILLKAVGYYSLEKSDWFPK